MIVAILVICYVLFLRYLDRKNRERDRQKAGFAVTEPADFATIQRMLIDLSQRLASVERQYYGLSQRAGGAP